MQALEKLCCMTGTYLSKMFAYFLSLLYFSENAAFFKITPKKVTGLFYLKSNLFSNVWSLPLISKQDTVEFDNFPNKLGS